jgi:hypothetical protein
MTSRSQRRCNREACRTILSESNHWRQSGLQCRHQNHRESSTYLSEPNYWKQLGPPSRHQKHREGLTYREILSSHLFQQETSFRRNIMTIFMSSRGKMTWDDPHLDTMITGFHCWREKSYLSNCSGHWTRGGCGH